MRRALKFADICTSVCDWAARLAAVLMVLLVFIIMYDVIGSQFFAVGAVVLSDLQWHFHGVIALFSIGFAYTRNAHVRIDVLADRMNGRFRLWMEFWVLALLVVPFALILLIYGFEFAERAYVRGEGAAGGRGLPHRWVIKSVIPASAVLILLACVAVMIRIVAVLRRPDLIASPFLDRLLWKR